MTFVIPAQVERPHAVGNLFLLGAANAGSLKQGGGGRGSIINAHR